MTVKVNYCNADPSLDSSLFAYLNPNGDFFSQVYIILFHYYIEIYFDINMYYSILKCYISKLCMTLHILQIHLCAKLCCEFTIQG